MKKTLFSILVISLLLVPSYASEYDRSNWPHWANLSNTCLNVRHWVLYTRSKVTPEVRQGYGSSCYVTEGLWTSKFTNKNYTNPGRLDIDHLVPLGYAYAHGGEYWSRDRKTLYANYTFDKHHLLIVELGLNRQKGARGPSEWLPPENECWYIRKFLKVITKWDMWIDSAELVEIEKRQTYHCLGEPNAF